jgi:hypothetical protein
MPSIEVRHARVAARNAIEKAQAEVNSARSHAENTRNSHHFTPEGIRETVGARVKNARSAAGSSLARAEQHTAGLRAQAEDDMRAALTVPEEERAASAAVLAPVLAAAAYDPSVLIDAYRNRAPHSLADRLVLEDTIQAVSDAGMVDTRFDEKWSRTRAKLADAVTTRGERLAAKELAAVAGLEAYVASAKSVIEGELGDIESDTQSFGVQNETQRFLVSQYERGMDSGTLDTQAPDAVDVSGMLEESGGHSAFRWLPEDFEPQDTTGVPASGTGAAGGGEGNA